MASFEEWANCPRCQHRQVIIVDELEPDETHWAFERCEKCSTPYVSRWHTPPPQVTAHAIGGIVEGGALDGD